MAEKKTKKFSVAIRDSQLRRDIEMLAELYQVSITDIVNYALKVYRDSKPQEIELLRQQDKEIQELKTQLAANAIEEQAANDSEKQSESEQHDDDNDMAAREERLTRIVPF